MIAARVSALALAVVLAGCAMPRADGGFTQVAGRIEQTTGVRPMWPRAEHAHHIDMMVNEQLAQPLTADAAARIALLNSPALHARFAELGVSDAQLAAAKSLFTPHIEGAVRFPPEGSAVLDFGLAVGFIDLLMTPQRVAAAKADHAQAEAAAVAAAIEAMSNARAAFIRAQAAEQVHELLTQAEQATRVSAAASQALFQAGNVPELVPLNDKLLHEEARSGLAASEAAVIAAREGLNAALGLSGEQTEWKAAGRLPEPPAEPVDRAAIEQAALKASLDVAAARAALTASARRAGIANVTAFVDDVEAGVTAEREDGHWSVGPSLALSLPMVGPGAARKAAARYAVMAAEERYRQAIIEVRSTARALAAETEAARVRALHMRQAILPLAVKLTAETQKQFNAMQIGVDALVIAKRRELAAGRSYIESLADYWQSRTRLDSLLAGRNPGTSAVAVPNAAPESTGEQH